MFSLSNAQDNIKQNIERYVTSKLPTKWVTN